MVIAQLIQGLLFAVIGLVAVLGFEITALVIAAIVALYVAVASIVTYLLRGQVYSPSTVESMRPRPNATPSSYGTGE